MDTTIPPFTTSAMDGFCMMSMDVRFASTEVNLRLNIVDNIPAGSWRTDGLVRGEAARIATGSPLPIGCGAVLPLEWIKISRSDGRLCSFDNRCGIRCT